MYDDNDNDINDDDDECINDDVIDDVIDDINDNEEDGRLLLFLFSICLSSLLIG